MQNEWTFCLEADFFGDYRIEHRQVTGELCTSAVSHNQVTYTSDLHDAGELCAWYGRFLGWLDLPGMAPCSN